VDRTATALGTWRTGDSECGFKINVGRRDDGVFVLHIVAQRGHEEMSRVIMVANEAKARAVLRLMDGQVTERSGLPPLSWVSADEFAAEIAEAA
jgi:hypothetical protein